MTTMALKPTSLKMPSTLKTRVDAAAKAAGTTPHAFMLAAIEQETKRTELYAEFLAEAREAGREFERTGEHFEHEDVFRYLSERIAGKNPPPLKPKIWPKKWRR
jgi:predicted transcriptional regulator